MKNIILSLAFFTSTSAFGAKTVFSDVTPEQPVCYGREYALSQLTRSPKQTVQKIQVKLSKIKKYDQTVMAIELTLKGQKNTYKNYRAFFDCDKGGDCRIDCDGGSARIQLSREGHLLLTNHGFAIDGTCDGEAEPVILKATSGGDDLFKLVRLPSAFCQNVTDYSN